MCLVEGVPSSEVWLADSGATVHMTRFKNYFVEYEPFDVPKKVYIGNNDAILAYGQGTINVEMKIHGKWERNHLAAVWYVPDISRNLFSIGQTLAKGFEFKASKGECVFVRDNIIRLKGICTDNGLYALKLRVKKPVVSANVCIAVTNDLQLWHERLCHQNKTHVKEILNKHGIKVTAKEDELCEGCYFGKQSRKSFGVRKQRATKAGELIHADVVGPMHQKSLGNAKYFVCLKDDFSKYRRVFFMHSKNEVSKCIKIFVNEAKNAGYVIKEVLSDGGTEFQNSEVRKILESEGITSRISMPYTPQQNGAAERENRTLVESARTMLHSKNLPLKLWAEAVNTSVYILNRTGTSLVKGKSPYELWFDKEVTNINHLRVFGTECFVHIPKCNRKKWDRKSIKGILVGYSGEKDGYRVYIKE